MFRIARSFSLAVLLSLAWICVGYAQSVPLVTGEYDDDGNPPGRTPFSDYSAVVGVLGIDMRENCDPEIMEVIHAQAWEAAQREITQNANIYVRPDSVLSLTCFDSWLDHQARYAARNFPGDPDESEGLLLGGFVTDIMIIMVDDIISSIDVSLTNGYVQYAILELLVLDQLEDVGSIIGHVLDFPGLALCGGGKEYYIDDSFPNRMIGDRAKTQVPTPAYGSIGSGLDNNVSDGSNYNCSMMSTVWNRTKCYDFATEEDDFYHPAGVAYAGWDHDGFYTYEDYVATANLGWDYRLEPDMCASPDDDVIDWPPILDVLCWVQIHGGPALPALSTLFPLSLFLGLSPPGMPEGSPEWNPTHIAANPVAGAPGAGDIYQHYLAMISGSSGVCAAPIRTGFVVIRDDSQYYDAVCPNPGCFFTAPATLVGVGTCTN